MSEKTKKPADISEEDFELLRHMDLLENIDLLENFETLEAMGGEEEEKVEDEP